MSDEIWVRSDGKEKTYLSHPNNYHQDRYVPFHRSRPSVKEPIWMKHEGQKEIASTIIGDYVIDKCGEYFTCWFPKNSGKSKEEIVKDKSIEVIKMLVFKNYSAIILGELK